MFEENPSPPDTPDAPRRMQVARLDADGVFQGVEEIDLAQLTVDHVPLPDGCDLPPGRYRWLPERQAFWPIEEHQP
jgi:hypothetical protein